jgi:hypothetical protein
LVLVEETLRENLKMTRVGDLVDVEAGILLEDRVDAGFHIPFCSSVRP